MVGDITDTYVTSFQKMMRDDNFTVEELGAIAFGYKFYNSYFSPIITLLRQQLEL